MNFTKPILLSLCLFPFAVTQAATVTPKITKISVTPTSAPAGTMFKFIAELNVPLIAGNKVKIDLGKGLALMTGTKTSYSLSRAIYTTGSQTYKVGIYNAKNVLQDKVFSGSYTVSSAASVNHAPTLALIKAETSAITNTAYTVTLNAKDVDANLNTITMNWGDNSEPETVTATDSNDLVFSHTYTTASSFGWNAFASDKGTPVLSSKSVSKIVTVSNPTPVEIIAPPAKTTGYTKIANNGSELPDSATLGSNPTDWACTKDNKTGLVWEVKTTDGGLRDVYKHYRNYTADYDPNKLYGAETNADGFIVDVNSQGLCGKNDWRVPTIQELSGLLFCFDGKYTTYGNEYGENANGAIDCTNYSDLNVLTINTTYFPNTLSDWFWSSSPYAFNSNFAWSVSNHLDRIDKNAMLPVRLVR
jgi:hypothetical protein